MDVKLLLLHGLGANHRVWDGITALTAAETLAPDLPGHGAAAGLPTYDFEGHAQALLERHGQRLRDGPWRILGHSMGGAAGIALTALAPELDVRGIVTVGVKTAWPDADVAGMHRVADKGTVWFDDAPSAAARFIKVSGLTGLVDETAGVVRHGIIADAGRWRFAADPETYRLTPRPLGEYLARVRCPVLMASGEHDAMAPASSLGHLGREVAELPGLGHNAHVEDPGAVLALLDRI